MTSTTRHSLSLALSVLAAVSLAGPVWLRANPAVATTETGVTAPVTFSREQVIASLTRAIVAHFNLEGDLQLELLRAWTPPARAAHAWDLEVLEFPATASSTMMLRSRVVADGAPFPAETNILVRAQLWRDAWVARQPAVSGGVFDASALETRRVDLLRDREALPAAVGDRSYIFARAVSAGRVRRVTGTSNVLSPRTIRIWIVSPGSVLVIR